MGVRELTTTTVRELGQPECLLEEPPPKMMLAQALL
jgi:hypothetical protein